MGWEIVCKECRATFLFDDAEQERYARDGFAPPKRCRACRGARRSAGHPASERLAAAPREQGPDQAARRTPVAMHEVQCGACGVLTRVPFEPTDLRPVYCKTCFQYR